MRLGVTLGIMVLLVIAVGPSAYAPYHTQPTPAAAAAGGNVKTQVKTAATHAGFAAGGDSLAYVQQHLGHALNCLEGAKGKNFNKSWGNVCEGQGNGILVDLKGAPGGAAWMAVAEAAGGLAVSGEKTKDLATAKAAAKGVAVLLGAIDEALK